MSTSLSIRFKPEEVRTLAAGSIGAAYMGIGSSFSRPIRVFILQNLTDALLMFSFDGTTDHLPLPENGHLIIDITANKTREDGYYLAEGDRLYVKEIGSPTTGSVYLTTFYGAN